MNLSSLAEVSPLLMLVHARLHIDFDSLPMRSVGSAGIRPASLFLGETNGWVFGKTNERIEQISSVVVGERFNGLLIGDCVAIELSGERDESIHLSLVSERQVLGFAHGSSRPS